MHQYLLSYEGSEFYGIPLKEVDDVLRDYNNCIPICKYDNDGNETLDELYILSENSLYEKGKRTSPFTYSNEYKMNFSELDESFTLFIIGDNLAKIDLISEVQDFEKTHKTKVKIVEFDFDQNLDEVAKQINETHGLKKLMILSKDRNGYGGYDENLFVTLLGLLVDKRLRVEAEIFGEIINPDNLVPLKNLGVPTVIVSNRVISLFMNQLLFKPSSRRFYRDILTTNTAENGGDVDIEVCKVKELFSGYEQLTFKTRAELVSCIHQASNGKRAVIAVKKIGEENLFGLDTKMDESIGIVLNPEDELVTITIG